MYLINISNIWTVEYENSFIFRHRFLFVCQIPDMAVWANKSGNMTTLMVLAYFYALRLCIFPIFITMIGIKATNARLGDPIIEYVMYTTSAVYMI